MQSNGPVGDSYDFMQASVKVVIGWVEGAVMGGKDSCCFHLCSSTEHGNCIRPALNMWLVVTSSVMDSQTYCKAEKMAF